MRQKEVLDTLERCGAFIHGHFVLKSGLHANAYVNKDAAYVFPEVINRICAQMADQFISLGVRVEVVVGPAVAGAVLSSLVGRCLFEELEEDISSVYADKDGDGFTLKRGYDKIVEGKKCLVVEDILTTGGSVKKVVDVVRECGGEVVAVSAIVNRGQVTAEMVRVSHLFSLVDLDLETWPADECPLCRDGHTVDTDVGHGAAFVAAQA